MENIFSNEEGNVDAQFNLGTIKDEMPKWTSGNCDIDNIIQMTQSDENANVWEIWRWIDYSKLKNIECEFGRIWKAEWIDMPEEVFELYKSNQVALKKFKDSQEISSEILKEVNSKCTNTVAIKSTASHDFFPSKKSISRTTDFTMTVIIPILIFKF
ncbi:hypothetical protein Glove_344g48 [Diversispora epigaea]|uniref:Uncharacterized protein n=1 Tax=Diversispora epigaea TaxID=1348612 RepID=A0A397HLE8_9GLOM|nr:hypothetical protein Glove_344g50 [Diversispora epigaea]RHZ62067.1 hypothetical protein Glove_344g48 [Diversispora epigaea]